MGGGLGKALACRYALVQVGACWHEWAHIGGASVDCRTFLLVQSKGAKMVVTNLFHILSPVKLNESILE